MNPRYRRLLIPGLLIVLIVIVLITSLARESRGTARAQPPTSDGQVVSTISDPRITESSGLVLSLKHDDLAYTINDSGNDPVVFAVKVSTGKVVGATRLTEPWTDAEALSIDKTGKLWIADTGDNAGVRDEVTLLAIPEPGPGEHRSEAQRHRLTFPDGPQDVEALVINPTNNAKYLISKDLGGGQVYSVPDVLDDNELSAVDGGAVAPLLTDGAFTPDGKHVLLRDYGTVRSYDAATWKQTSIARLPQQKQGETLAVEPRGGTVLIGSEGVDSQLIRVAVTARTQAAPDPSPDTGDSAADDDGSTPMGTTWLILAFVLVAGAGILVVRRRR